METTTPPPSDPPSSPTQQPLRIGPIIRDVAIVVGLTFIGGLIIGLAGPATPQRKVLAIVISNLSLGTLGFVISGCLAVGDRWRHLAYVALGVWLFGLVNVIFMGFSVIQWVLSIIAVTLMTAVGGALSYIFRKS